MVYSREDKMKRKIVDPNSPEAIQAAVDFINQMTPEERYTFFTYRTPGVEETDMTGMYGGTQSGLQGAYHETAKTRDE